MTDLESLTNTAEEIRSKEFADLPPELLRKVIAVEARLIDERVRAQEEVEKLVEASLSGGA